MKEGKGKKKEIDIVIECRVDEKKGEERGEAGEVRVRGRLDPFEYSHHQISDDTYQMISSQIPFPPPLKPVSVPFTVY
jgi:hypothetical protein